MTTNDADKVSRTDCTPWRDRETLVHFYHGRRYSLLETAEAVGCTEGTISQWCSRLDVETRDAQEARDTGTPSELENREWLRRRYRDDELTCAEIADEVGVTSLTVSNWLRRHDIPTRPAYGTSTRVKLNCKTCGATFEAIQSRKDKRKYCSRECYYDGMHMPTGEDHWSWKETPERRPNGREWDELRARCRRRDDYSCQLCGIHESDYKHELDVHHLRRVREFENPRDANALDNVVSLCRSCHRKAEPYAPLLPVQ